MFSTLAFCASPCNTFCQETCQIGVDPKKTAKVTFITDIITALALLLIGFLSITGTIPNNVLIGGFLIGFGTIELIVSAFVTRLNCRHNSE